MVARHLKTPAVGATASFAASQKVTEIVKSVIDDVRANGDKAVRSYSEKFDKWTPDSFKLSDSQIQESISRVPEQTIQDIKEAQKNVRIFAQAQRDSMKDIEIEIQPGVFLGHRNNPINTAGAYIPGGRYPLLASAHMTILTAKVAGVKHVIACTPPINGQIPDATVAAAHLAGADEIFILGGTQAVAAMALGTETIRKVEFLAGPGNAFVAEAKRQLFGEIGIDLLAGPTETLLVTDDLADPFTVATDLLSQAEHGPDTPAVLITTSEKVARESIRFIDEQLKTLSTAALAATSWRDYGQVIVVDDLDEAYALADDIASEHVQILTQKPREALEQMTNYGALYTGGLWVGKYLKTQTYQEVVSEKASGELGRLCGRCSRAENFEGHARSGDLRSHLYLKDQYDWIDQARA
ncbi:Histidinol dehydrogenase 1 [Cytospora mali]|uniref:Histidinol dehydrogenase n=1 Tax=Cytospora mali TaxID=578113 RepID=A0A194USD9_CYTMA|nr:Histidinol dehydrogenase 1 [Valsa mali var. pyri (nom. inval.)]